MTATQTTTDLRSAIDKGNRQLIEALSNRDIAMIRECYTTDAQVLPAGFDIVSGRQAIGEFWSGALAAGVASAKLETQELAEGGDSAWEVGRYRLHGADGGQVDHGKYIVIWKQEGGKWKLHRDIWTTSVSQPA